MVVLKYIGTFNKNISDIKVCYLFYLIARIRAVLRIIRYGNHVKWLIVSIKFSHEIEA